MEEQFVLLSDTVEFAEYKGYRVSNLGSVQSNRDSFRGKARGWHTLSGCVGNNGYRVIGLMGILKAKRVKVAVLVLSAFRGVRSKGIVCRHLDGNKLNDTLDNLAWGTQKENKADELETGHRMRGEKHHNCKLTEPEVIEIYNRAITGENQRTIAREFGIRNSNVSMIKRKQAWQHIHEGLEAN